MSQTKERPILMNGAMVRATLRDTNPKTQTRRIVKTSKYRPDLLNNNTYFPTGRVLNYLPTQPGAFMEFRYHGQPADGASFLVPCPFGKISDRLYVRESFNRTNPGGERGVYYYKADDGFPACVGGTKYFGDESWKPSIHMPRAASRILLEIVSVRVERLQDISEADAIAEGIYSDPAMNGMYTADGDSYTSHVDGAIRAFAALWESINGPGSWDANPWVWVVEFKRIENGVTA